MDTTKKEKPKDSWEQYTVVQAEQLAKALALSFKAIKETNDRLKEVLSWISLRADSQSDLENDRDLRRCISVQDQFFKFVSEHHRIELRLRFKYEKHQTVDYLNEVNEEVRRGLGYIEEIRDVVTEDH